MPAPAPSLTLNTLNTYAHLMKPRNPEAPAAGKSVLGEPVKNGPKKRKGATALTVTP